MNSYVFVRQLIPNLVVLRWKLLQM